MKIFGKWVIGVGIVLAPVVALAQGFQVTPAVQAELDRAKAIAETWAADPVIVEAVKAQNAKGPIAGMDNAKWKGVRRTDPIVQGMVGSPAGQFLKAKAQATGGLLAKVFLSGSLGQKVAFGEKTISYLHKGQEKFDAPMSSGKPWQMAKPWFDESLQSYELQIAVPVLDGGAPIGVLVASVPAAHLEKVAKK